jgi:hypothetical protein
VRRITQPRVTTSGFEVSLIVFHVTELAVAVPTAGAPTS